MARLEVTDIPLVGAGEQSAAAPGEFGPGEAWRLENGYIAGRGIIAQAPDWRLAGTGTDGASTEVAAICGIFPFAQQGGLSTESAGVAFGYSDAADAIYLYHLDENGAIQRTKTVFSGVYTLSTPPQITGFEMFGRFYLNVYGKEAAAGRMGFAYYDPASTGTITQSTFQLNGGTAARLRFRGIALHRGGTILGWGYTDEVNPEGEHIVRYCKYGDPTTWVPASADGEITAGKFALGTLNTPVVAAAASGQYTILGKEKEVFALDGDYSGQFYTRPIGQAHGPVSTTGMVTTGPLAVWMGERGPAYSENGGKVALLGMDKLLRRFLSYFDLTYASAVHDSLRNRVGWLLRRQYDYDGLPVAKYWGDEILWWDYERDQFYVHRTPETCFTIGTIKDLGIAPGGPLGPPTSLSASSITAASATISWASGDAQTGTTTTIQYRVVGDTDWVSEPSVGSGVVNANLTGLEAGTEYDVQLFHFRNGQYSAALTASPLFTTLAADEATAPSNFTSTLLVG